MSYAGLNEVTWFQECGPNIFYWLYKSGNFSRHNQKAVPFVSGSPLWAHPWISVSGGIWEPKSSCILKSYCVEKKLLIVPLLECSGIFPFNYPDFNFVDFVLAAVSITKTTPSEPITKSSAALDSPGVMMGLLPTEAAACVPCLGSVNRCLKKQESAPLKRRVWTVGKMLLPCLPQL